MRTRVEVTAEDIAKGVPFDGQNCPVALAVRVHLDEGIRLDVFDGKVQIYRAFSGKAAITIMLPDVASEWPNDFDDWSELKKEGVIGTDCMPPAPIAFDLDIPNEFLKSTEAK